MRTTVEIRNSQCAELIRLAKARGEKGFAKIVHEAIEDYLDAHRSRRERVEAALGCFGTLSDDRARALRAEIRRSRGGWR